MSVKPRENLSPNVKYMKLLTVKDYRSLAVAPGSINRVCLHEPGSSGPQVMFIRLASNTVYPSHLHLVETEWYVLLEGDLFITLSGSHSDKLQRLHMSRSGDYMSLSIDPNVAHAVESGPDGAIFLEVREGPFVRSNTVFCE